MSSVLAKAPASPSQTLEVSHVITVGQREAFSAADTAPLMPEDAAGGSDPQPIELSSISSRYGSERASLLNKHT